MHDDHPISDQELTEIERITAGATVGPWEAFIEEREPMGGVSFIRMGAVNDAIPDMYVYHEDKIAPAHDLDFIAAARTYMPRLVAELRRTRSS